MTSGTRSSIPLVVVSLAAVAIALVLAATAPDIGPWGDGLGIVQALQDRSGENPRAYHLGYFVLARLAAEVGGALGLHVEPSLIHLSRAAIAVGAATTVFAAVRCGARPSNAVGWIAVALASPSLLFFSGTVEVHGVQFAGSAVALAVALEALRVERAALRRILVGVAALIALVVHLSHLLLVPAFLALLLLGRGRDLSRRDARGVLLLALLGAGVAIGSWFVYDADRESSSTLLLRAPWYLGLYEDLFLRFRSGYGWFGPVDVVRYLWHEGALQGGLVWVAALLALAPRRATESESERDATGRPVVARAAVVVLLVVYVLVVPQSGLRERGAYFVSLFPWFVVAASSASAARGRAWRLAPWVLLPLQLVLSHADLAAYARRPDARSWARVVVEEVDAPCTVYTADMVRLSALPLDRVSAFQWTQQFEFTPRRAWDDTLRAPYEAALVDALSKGALYLDSEILGPDDGERTPAQQWARDLLDRPKIVLTEVPSPFGPGPLLHRVEWDASAG
ncbi:MAG: hypothetical protein R3F34_11320 [Planctomycetota bacterium]